MLNVSLVDTFKMCCEQGRQIHECRNSFKQFSFRDRVNILVQFLFTNIYIFDGLHSQLLKAKPLARI